MNKAGLEARFRKQLRQFALEMQLEVAHGITAIYGPSGSGKSISLHCIGGFVPPDTGRILVDGHLYFDGEARVNLRPEERRCGYLFQDHSLFPHMTVRENLQFAVAVRSGNGTRSARRKQISELLEHFALTAIAHRKGADLSGGERQRAALARVLLNEPRILLLDEPSRGLDSTLREGLYQALEETQRRLNVPVLLVTHDNAELHRLANAVVLLEAGQVVAQGEASEMLSRPPSVPAARALHEFNLVTAEVVRLDPSRNTSSIRVEGAEIPGPYLRGRLLGDRGFLCFRPYDVEPLSEPVAGTFPLEIESAVRTATGVELHSREGLVIPGLRGTPLQLPDRIWVRLPPSAVHFLS